MLSDDLEGWDGGGGREAPERGHVCIHMADSHCCTEKTSATL